MRRAFAVAEQEVNVYLAHVAALFVPGVRVRSLPVHPGKVGTLSEWSEAELVLLVEEGRRQLDRQRADLDRVQARSQLLFTTAAALLVVLTAEFETMASRGGMVFVAWYLGLALVALGLLGSAALMSIRSDFAMVDTARLSQQSPPVLEKLARSYAQVVEVGENTVATRLTVFRDAVWLIVVGAALQGGVWLITR